MLTEQEKLILEIMQLAFLVQCKTKYCVFLDYSGHVNSLDIRICESPEKWQNEVLKTEFYADLRHMLEKDENDKLAWLKAKINILKHILTEEEIPYEECDYEEVVERYYEF